MNKIKEAQLILKELGLPSQQHNKICALTLLALAGIKENSKWSSATKKSLTLSKDIIEFVNKEYNQSYKPNTRESFRKIALNPFVKHDIALLNPDNPALTPSSSKTHYSLTDSIHSTIKTFKTSKWKNNIKSFKQLLQQKKSLEIKNFKSIKNIKLNFSRINILIGKPNSGKSNFLEALTLFNYIKGRQNKPNEFGLIRYNTLDNIFFDRDIEKEISIQLNDNFVSFTYQSSINAFVQAINPSPEYLDVGLTLFKSNLSLNDIQNQVPFLSKELDLDSYSSKYAIFGKEGNFIQNGETSEKENPVRRYEFRDGINYNDFFGGYLKSNGENLFTIVQSNNNLREWINSFFEEYKLEFLIDFSSRIFEIQKKENRIVYKIPFELTPDTFRRMLFHVAAIYSSRDTTILFEEPESHSFPPYIRELSELIKTDSNNNTYFITTHSPYFFNSMIEDSRKTNDISFFHVYYEDYQTKIRKLTEKELNNIWGSGADVFFNIDSLNR